MPADHMANVQLGQFVLGQVQHREALIAQPLHQRSTRIGVRVGLHTDKNVRFFVLVEAVVELGDLPLADSFAEGLEAAWLLGNGHGDDRLTFFAQLGALGDMAQAIKVDVGTGVDTHQHLAAAAFALHVLLDPGDTQRAGRLGD